MTHCAVNVSTLSGEVSNIRSVQSSVHSSSLVNASTQTLSISQLPLRPHVQGQHQRLQSTVYDGPEEELNSPVQPEHCI